MKEIVCEKFILLLKYLAIIQTFEWSSAFARKRKTYQRKPPSTKV